MKTLFTSLLLVAASFGTLAQTSLTQAVDFTVTFTDGEQFNLFDKLAEGKHVVIDFFYTTCGPCQANQPSYTGAFQNFGCNTGDIFFLSLESTVGDAETIAYEETFAGDNAPPAASGTDGDGIEATALYGIGAFPTFILIAPDGTILEQDMWPLTNGADTFTDYLSGGHGLNLQPCTSEITTADASEVEVNIYPNPATDNVTIDLGSVSGTALVCIYNIVGEKVASASTDNAIVKFDVAELPVGNYIAKIIGTNQSTQRQFSVIH